MESAKACAQTAASGSDLQQELIGLADGREFVARRGPVLLDEDFLHAHFLESTEQLFPIRGSLAEWCVLGKIAGDGGREPSGPFLDMGEFESMRVLFKIGVRIAATGDE